MKDQTTFKIGNETITLTPLRWKVAMLLVKELCVNAASLVDGNGKVVSNRDQINKILTESENVLSTLINYSTGKDQKWIDDLTAPLVEALVQEIIDLNFSREISTVAKNLITKTFLVEKA